MNLERPDLSLVSPDVRAYIEALEAELAATRKSPPRARESFADELAELNEPSEPPTTFQVITATAGGIIKRTPRHLYDRQRRGGMGVFDLDAPDRGSARSADHRRRNAESDRRHQPGTGLPAGRKPAR